MTTRNMPLTLSSSIKSPPSFLIWALAEGKTVTTLTAIRDLMYDTFEVKRVLVVAPLRVARDTWPEEIRKWDHLKDLTCSVVVGSVAERRRALQKKADIIYCEPGEPGLAL